MRGKGIYQEGMEAALEILNQGGWIHIFSEGRVYPQPPMGVNMPLRWGIARLILECNIEPIVIPVIHKGETIKMVCMFVDASYFHRD